ncbi:MAG: multiheme c-type cytochrome [Myxococcota bacterium]
MKRLMTGTAWLPLAGLFACQVTIDISPSDGGAPAPVDGGATSSSASSSGEASSSTTSPPSSSTGSSSSSSGEACHRECLEGCVPGPFCSACVYPDGSACEHNPFCPDGRHATRNGVTYDCASEEVWGTFDDECVILAPGNQAGMTACELLCSTRRRCQPPPAPPHGSACMACHNGDPDFDDNGLEQAHPWSSWGNRVGCVNCHGGESGNGMYKDRTHVCPPPDIAQIRDNGEARWEGVIQEPYGARAWSRYLHKAGLDKSAVDGVLGIPDQWNCPDANGEPTRVVTKLDYLQFVAPGDLRVVEHGRSCGQCHVTISKYAPRSVIGMSVGLISTSRFMFGIPNAITGADAWGPDYAVRDITTPDGAPLVLEPTFTQQWESVEHLGTVTSTDMATGVESNPALFPQPFITYGYNRIHSTDNELAKAMTTAFVKACGACHAGNNGLNNTTGSFRGAGCASCHMEYGLDGRYVGADPNLSRTEPRNPDFLLPGERPHVREHVLRGRFQRLARRDQPELVLPGLHSLRACLACHQGTNHTVLQYLGIRPDQNQDVLNQRQYPGNPFASSFADGFVARDGTRLLGVPYGPGDDERTRLLSNRVATQYVQFEDYGWRNIFYDPNFGGTPNANQFGNRVGTGRDDTPADIHYERGLECYDCHTSTEMHGTGSVLSRGSHALTVMCESCHGNADAYAALSENGFALDRAGNELKNVYQDETGRYYLIGKRDGVAHFIPQVKDLVNRNTVVTHPRNNQSVYSANADFAMGRTDFDTTNGDGPLQGVAMLDQALRARGFSHLGSPANQGGVACFTCHTSWQNQCVGCHLDLEARAGADADEQMAADHANHNTGGVPDLGFPWVYNIGPDFLSNVNSEPVFTTLHFNSTYTDVTTFFIGLGSRGRIVPFTTHQNWFNFIDKDGVRLQDVMALMGVQVSATSDGYTYGLVEDAKGFFSDRFGRGSSAGNRGRMTSAGGFNPMMPHSQRGRTTETQWGGYGTACFHCHLTEATRDNPSARDLVRTTTGLGALTYKKFAADRFGCPMNFIQCTPNPTINQPAGIANCAGGTALDNHARPFLFDGNTNLCPPATTNNDPAKVFADYDLRVTANGISNVKTSQKIIEIGGTTAQGSLEPDSAGPLGAQHLQLLNNLNNSGVVLTQWLDWKGARCNVATCPDGFMP